MAQFEQANANEIPAATIQQVVGVQADPPPMPDDLGRKRIERERSQLADRFASKALSASDFMAETLGLDDAERALQARGDAPHITAEQVEQYIRDIQPDVGTSWSEGTG